MNVDEQETVINYSRANDKCQVYTSDVTVMTKLKKLENFGWEKIKEEFLHGKLVSETWQTNKNKISFRKEREKKQLSEEQRKMYSERIKKMHEKRKQKINNKN